MPTYLQLLVSVRLVVDGCGCVDDISIASGRVSPSRPELFELSKLLNSLAITFNTLALNPLNSRYAYFA